MTIPAPAYAFSRYLSSRAPGFAQALELYRTLIPVAGQADAQELAYWVDRGGQVSDDVVAHCCSFSVNGAIVGFAHWGVLGGERLGFLDYLALDPSARQPAARAAFLGLLHRALLASGAERVLTEVLDHPALVRFCRQAGFRVLEAPYFQPPMGHGTVAPASLMVWGQSEAVPSDTYVHWVESLYRRYYLPWHAPFLEADSVGAYEAGIENLMAQIRHGLTATTVPWGR